MAFEAGGKVATSAIDALKSTPVAMALIGINVLFLIAGVWMFHELSAAVRDNRESAYKLMTAMIERGCKVP